MPLVTVLSIAAVRIATGLIVLALLVFGVRGAVGWLDSGWLDKVPSLVFLPIGVALFWAWWLGCSHFRKAIPSERIAAMVSRREDAALEMSPRLSGIIGVLLSVMLVIFVINNSRRLHDAPDDARVFVAGHRMVPSPLREALHEPGQEMTLREARTLGAKPITEGIDRTYTSSGYGWLFTTPDTGWTVEWPPEEPEDRSEP